MRMRVGLDIGGTKTHAVVVDERGELTHEVRLPTGFGADAVIATAATAVRRLAELAHIATHEFASVGVGIPGTVDRASGRVSHAVNLGLAALSLADELTRVVHVDVRVENDVNAAAVGAYRLLGGASGGSMAYLNLGTGLAAGLVLDGELWRGSRGTAGEIGHIPVDPRGERCPCGQFGCLELVASGSSRCPLVADERPQPGARPVRLRGSRGCRGGGGEGAPRRQRRGRGADSRALDRRRARGHRRRGQLPRAGTAVGRAWHPREVGERVTVSRVPRPRRAGDNSSGRLPRRGGRRGAGRHGEQKGWGMTDRKGPDDREGPA